MFVFVIGCGKSNYRLTAQYFLLARKERKRNCTGMEPALKVYENRMQKIRSSRLNEVMQKAMESYDAPVCKRPRGKIEFVTQLPTSVLSFSL